MFVQVIMAEAIRAKLQTGEAKIQRKSDAKSDVWKRFGLVVMSDDTISDFAICLKCETAASVSLRRQQSI